MNKKNILIAVLFMVMCFSIFQGFNSVNNSKNNTEIEKTKTITTKNPDGTTTTQVIKENSEPKEELKYYDNVVDAVRNCKYSDKQYKNFSKENILVLEENDNACVVLANINDKNDAILYYELEKKCESNKIFYSSPISAGKSSWKANKMDLHGTFLVKDTMNLNEKIIDDLKTFSNDFLEKNQLSFWGIADDER
ncbi:MAG: hypothetical protein RR806_08880, partial [Oscillospiraceae bacterium]